MQTSQSLWQKKVADPESSAAEAAAAARLKLSRTDIYPDANGTLRLSYGKVAGFHASGRYIGPFTTIQDLLQGSKGQNTTSIDPRWVAARNKLAADTILDIYTTNDGVNGNSGSPLINAQGDVIGAFYGGNDAGFAGDYEYEPAENRALAVSAAAVNEALTKVYGAHRLLSELAQ